MKTHASYRKAISLLASIVLSLVAILAIGYAAPEAQAATRANCSYTQNDTPPPFGDHRWAINYTCDQGLKHWFVAGGHKYYGSRQVPLSYSDADCAKITSLGGVYIPSRGGSCRYIPSDLLPTVSDWGNVFG